MRSLTVPWLSLPENLGHGLVDASSTEVGLKVGDLVDGKAHILVIVFDATLIEHELVARAIAADVKFAASR